MIQMDPRPEHSKKKISSKLFVEVVQETLFKLVKLWCNICNGEGGHG